MQMTQRHTLAQFRRLCTIVLNSFHKSGKLTFKKEKCNKGWYLYVLILRNDSPIEATVCCKLTHNDVYLHWNSFSSNSWKVGT